MESRSGAQRVVRLVAILCVLVTEYVALMAVYHLDDQVEARTVAYNRVDVAIDGWRPGVPTARLSQAVDGLAAQGAPGAPGLTGALRSFTVAPTRTTLAPVRAAATASGRRIDDQRDRTDLLVRVLVLAMFLVVCIGWFTWFNRLVRRHRALQHRLTERETVHAGERRLLTLIRNSSDLVVVLRPDSTASFVSPAAEQVLGWPADELTDRRLLDSVTVTDRPRLAQLLASSLDGEHALRLGFLHRDGRELALEGTVANLMSDPTVDGWVLTMRDVTERKRFEEALAHQAFHDALTGLANRQLFEDRLAHAMSRDSRSGPLAVLFLDVDDFKIVNDSLGHASGDELLVVIAQRLAGALREHDTVARLGGDEFAILLEDTEVAAASRIAQELLGVLAAPVALGNTVQVVRASIGISDAVPGEGTEAEVMRNADVAMYVAKDSGKDSGKGRVSVYDSGLHARALELMAVRAELREAITGGQLVVHYQPTVQLSSEAISGFEALVRWQHPVRGLLLPGDFIPVAEHSGLVVPLGEWVLRQACRDGARMQSPQHAPTVAVNVAPQQLVRDGFVDLVLSALETAALPADRLVLEVTETALLEDLDGSRSVLARLREHGVRVAIDDFGTGYSSLSQLTQLPVDVLKIDKSFVDRLCGLEQDSTLVRAIIAMSNGLRMTTVAEGIELPEQAAWLASTSCSLGQGWLWSRAVDVESALQLLVDGVPARPGPPGRPVRPVPGSESSESATTVLTARRAGTAATTTSR